ncbi:DinB family protein, partial [Candidatus Bathyarchaeota archaeon]|nr:DinB family protein [Candidatus Bathyarchaeota archaeon]
MNLQRLAEYQIWADNQARKLLEGLTDEEFSRDVLPPFGSIRNLCAHITLAIEFNLKHHMDKEEFDPEELGEEIHTTPKEDLLEMWMQADLRLLEFSESRTDETYVFRNFLGEGQITLDQDDYLSQYLLHTQHHRAQIMSALRVMGKEAVTTDYLFYLSD